MLTWEPVLLSGSPLSSAEIYYCSYVTIEKTRYAKRLGLKPAAIGVASYGALGHVPPPRLPASYNFKRTNTENVQKQRDFLRNFYQFWPIFCHLFAHSFPQGVIIVPKIDRQ